MLEKFINTKAKPRGGMRDMAKTIKVRFTDGSFRPLEVIKFPEGREFSITINDIEPKVKDEDGIIATAGAWKDSVNTDELMKNIYEDRARPSNRPEVKL